MDMRLKKEHKEIDWERLLEEERMRIVSKRKEVEDEKSRVVKSWKTE